MPNAWIVLIAMKASSRSQPRAGIQFTAAVPAAQDLFGALSALLPPARA
jgi:hypothetical protein